MLGRCMRENMQGMPRRKLIIVAFGWNLKNMAWGHTLNEGIKRNIQQQPNH